MRYTPKVTCTLRHRNNMCLSANTFLCTCCCCPGCLSRWISAPFKWLRVNMHLNCTLWMDKHKHGKSDSPQVRPSMGWSRIERFCPDNHLDSFQWPGRLRWKAPSVCRCFLTCASASVNEAVIHNQARLIKRLSCSVPPQWFVGGQILVLLSTINFYFYFTSLLLFIFFLCCPLEGFTPWTLEELKASDSLRLSPLNCTEGKHLHC